MSARAFAGLPLRVVATGMAFALLFAVVGRAVAVAPALEVDPFAVAPGQFVWHPDIAPDGPLVVVVSLDEQRAYVYRNGMAIGVSAVSSGRKGHATPTGVFTILQKERTHYSNLYDAAPMPYMERLTWDGIALHGGTLPGYPASHGCIRLPTAFAEALFSLSHSGETVVVAQSPVSAVTLVHPGLLAPVSAAGVMDEGPGDTEQASWDDRVPAEGPVGVLVSVHDRRVHVIRNGIRAGSATIDVSAGFDFHGSVLYVRLAGATNGSASGKPSDRWSAVSLERGIDPWPIDDLASRLHVPDAFMRRLQAIIAPGTSILVTDKPAIRAVPGPAMGQPVMESDDASGAKLPRVGTPPTP